MTLFPAVKLVSSLLQTDLSLKQKKNPPTVNAFFFFLPSRLQKTLPPRTKAKQNIQPNQLFPGKNFFSSLNISSPST